MDNSEAVGKSNRATLQVTLLGSCEPRAARTSQVFLSDEEN